MPIHHREQVLGCINVVFLKKDLSATEGAVRYAPDLKAAIKKIETQMRQRVSKRMVDTS